VRSIGCLGKAALGLAALVVAVALAPLLVPIPPLRDTVDPRALADADSRFVNVRGLDVHYKRAGDGRPAIVLLHGLGASTFSWREVLRPLGEVGTTVAYDRPGFGLTERPLPGEWSSEANPYAARTQVEILFGLLDALELERAVLVGHSAGGTLATLAALERPERVESLVLVAPAILTGGGVPAVWRSVIGTPQVRRIGPLLTRLLVRRSSAFLDLAYHDPSRITPHVVEGYERPFRAANWDVALWEFTLAAEYPDLAGRIDETRVPTLLVTGDDDRVVPTADTLRLAEMLPRAQLTVIPDCGHLPQEEQPDAFLEAVVPFLSGLARE